MASEWINARLGEYIDSCLGKMLDKNKNKGELYPYLGNSNVRWGSFDLDDLAHMKFEKHEHERYGIEYGDLIVCEGGEPGRCAIWEDDLPDMKIQKALHRVRTKDGLDSEFLYYWFLHSGRSGLLDAFFTGTTIKHLTGKALKQLPIKIPPLQLQHQVARVLRPLDKKIKLNQQTNQTLEKMAQALFKSWFVDFDPVVDNALVAGNPIPDQLAHRVEIRKKAHALPDFQPLPDNIRNFFPSEFEQTDEPTVGIGGWVPKGWSAMSLGDVTKELRRGISPKYTDEGGVQVINQKCIRNHEVNYALSRRNDPTLRKVDGREIKVGDVLVNSTGVGTLGRLAQVDTVPEPTVVDSHVTVVRPNPKICPIYFFAQLMISKEKSIESLGEGSTGQTELSRRVLAEQLVLVPPYEQAMLIEGQLKSMSDKSSQNLKQNSALAKLRDTLLPKLISGEIIIKDSKECNG